MITNSVLIVDDDEVIRKLIREYLEKNGIKSFLAASGEDALRFFKQKPTPVIISDVRMLEMNGIQLLKEIKVQSPETIIILMTAFGNLEDAIDAVQLGAFDYISKPFRMNELLNAVKRAFEFHQNHQHVNSKTNVTHPNEALTGKSKQIVDVYKQVARASFSQSNVLIIGESGIGKKQVAQAIHKHSPNRENPFLSISFDELKTVIPNLVPGTTLHIKNLQATKQIEQTQLLQHLESGLFEKIRLITSSTQPLNMLVKTKHFREDLYLRLNILSIFIPSLRERPDDIPELIDYFTQKIGLKNNIKIYFAPEALLKLKTYTWPGNIRELETTLERAMAQSLFTDLANRQTVIRPEQIQFELNSEALSSDETESLEALEKKHILKVLQDCDYNKSKTAEKLGIDRATLYRKTLKFGIDLKRALD